MAAVAQPPQSSQSKKGDYKKLKKLEKKRKRKEKKVQTKQEEEMPNSEDIKAMLTSSSEPVKDVDVEYIEDDEQILAGRVFLANSYNKTIER